MATKPRRRTGSKAAARPPVNTALISRVAVPVGVLLAVLVTAFGGPGLVFVMTGLLVKAFTIPPVEFTGAKAPGSSAPGPLNGPAGYEASSFATRQKWTSLKTRLTLPGKAWFSGWPLRWALVPAAACAGWMLTVPQLEQVDWMLRTFHAATAFALVMVAGHAMREFAAFQDPAPPVLLPHAKEAFAKTGIGGILKALAVGVAVAAPVGLLAWIFPVMTIGDQLPVTLAGTVVGVATLAYSKAVTDTAWAPYRLTRDGVAFWHDPSSSQSTWEAVGIKTAAPKLLSREQIGQATVDTFKAPSAEPFLIIAPKITPYFEAGSQVFVLPLQRTAGDGSPVPGEHDPNHFQVVSYPPDETVDVTDPDIDEAQLKLRIQCAMAAANQQAAIPHGTIDALTIVTAEDAPAGWGVNWTGYPASMVRSSARGILSHTLGAMVLVDHRGAGGAGTMFVGVSPDSALNPDTGLTARMIEDIIAEDEWNDRWAQLEEKYRVNPPTPKMNMLVTSTLANGAVVHKLPFTSRIGMPAAMFFNSEAQLKTVLKAPPFVAVCAFHDPKGRAGERHPQAFNLYWSEPNARIPSSPDQLAPATAGDGHLWVLAGMMNDSFRATKMPIPEVSSAKLLTDPSSHRRIWKIELRLFDGLTVDKVRKNADVIRSHFASEWVRVETTAQGCALIIGTNPVRAKLASPQVEKDLYELDWGQAFSDANATGANGALPKLLSVTTMPRNTAVKKLEFELPAGLQMSSVKGRAEKLGVATGNDFVEVSAVQGKAGRIIITCSETFPLADSIEPDYDFVAGVDRLKIPFATGLDGEPVAYDLKKHIHLLVVGLSGSGKSIIAQNLTTAVAAHDLELFVVDAVKGAADFKFLQPYTRAFATDFADAAAALKALYTEVEAIVKLNSHYGVSSYRNLPEEVRPKHKVLVIDEFFGHLLADLLPVKSNEPESIAAYDEAVYKNRCRSLIAAYAARILGEARSAGVSLIMLSQGLKANDLEKVPGGSNMKRNMSRLLAGKSTQGERASALRAPGNAPKLGDEVPPGRAIFESVVGAPVMIQCWYDPTESEGNGEFVASQRSPVDPSEVIDLEKYRPAKDEVGEIVDFDFDAEDSPNVVELEAEELELDLESLGITLTPTPDDEEPAAPEPAVDLSSLSFWSPDEDEDDHGSADADESEAEDFEEHDEALEDPDEEPALRLPPSPFADTEGDHTDDTDDEEEPMIQKIPGTPEQEAPAPAPRTLEELMAGTFDDTVAVVIDPYLVDSPADLAPVLAAGAQLWWTTSADPVLAEHGTRLPVAASSELGWAPADRALAQLQAHPDVTRLVMVEAGLAELDDMLDLPRAEVLTGVLAELGIDSLMIAPDAMELSDEEVDTIAAWLAAGAAAPVLPASVTAAVEEGLAVIEPEHVPEAEEQADEPVEDQVEGPAEPELVAEVAPESEPPTEEPAETPAAAQGPVDFPLELDAAEKASATEDEATDKLFAPPRTKVRDLRQRGSIQL